MHGLPLEMRRACRAASAITRTELLRTGAAILLKARFSTTLRLKTRCRTARPVEAAFLTRTAELLRLLPSFESLFRPPAHHARPFVMPLISTRTVLRCMELLTTALRKILRARSALGTEATMFMILWALRLAEMFRPSCIGLITTTIMRRMHRTAIPIALRLLLRLVALMLTTMRRPLWLTHAIRPSGVFTTTFAIA